MNNTALFKRDEIAKKFLDGLKSGLNLIDSAAQISDPDEQEVLSDTYKKGYFLGYRWESAGLENYNDHVYSTSDAMVEYVEEVRKIYPQLKMNEDIRVFMKNTNKYDKNLPGAELYNVRVYLPKKGLEIKGE